MTKESSPTKSASVKRCQIDKAAAGLASVASVTDSAARADVLTDDKCPGCDYEVIAIGGGAAGAAARDCMKNGCPHWIEQYYDRFQKTQGRIFFGSGDHGEGWRGTIDGAIGAGIRAAQQVRIRLL